MPQENQKKVPLDQKRCNDQPTTYLDLVLCTFVLNVWFSFCRFQNENDIHTYIYSFAQYYKITLAFSLAVGFSMGSAVRNAISFLPVLELCRIYRYNIVKTAFSPLLRRLRCPSSGPSAGRIWYIVVTFNHDLSIFNKAKYANRSK